MGNMGNMGVQSEIAYGEDGLNKLDESDGEFFTYHKLPKLPNFPILNYQLSKALGNNLRQILHRQ